MHRTGCTLVWMFALFVALPARSAAPDLLLLNMYRPGMDVSGWYMSEKLDGVRAYWDGQQLLSRQGNVFAAPAWFTEKLPPFELDGELWIARGRFEKTLSIVSKTKPHSEWHRLTYNIFEVPNSSGGLKTRLGRLQTYLEQHQVPYLQIIPQAICRNAEHLMVELSRVDSAGGEGLVLRNPTAPYATGRSHNALKVKRFDDMEGRVVGHRAGKGKYTGMIGALWIEIEDGRRFYIGSGLRDRDRVMPPPIGSVVTFRYQGVTRNGVPRFASFLRVRDVGLNHK